MGSPLAGLCGWSKQHVKFFRLFYFIFTICIFLQYIIASNVFIHRSDNSLTQILNDTNASVDLWKALTKVPGPHYHYILGDDEKTYFTKDEGKLCLLDGSFHNITGMCKCRPGWWGEYCSYPTAIQKDREVNWIAIKPRQTPRRVIYAVPFNIEFDMAEIRLHELGDVVDVFMFGESNFSSYGDPKPQRLLNALNDGFMREYQHKILYVYLDHFDPAGISNGWVSEALQRNNIGQQGLKKQLIGTKPDDLFIITDADEIPKKEALIFLKNHDGYPEPFGFTFQSYYYTFYWKKKGYALLHGGCTMTMVRYILDYNVYTLRGKLKMDSKLRRYYKLTNATNVKPWFMGGGRDPTGWHCSSCTTPKGIKQKLMSAQNGDFPRWGDFPGKMNEAYIRTLIILGLYFDEKTKLWASPVDRADIPVYVTQNKQRFSYLLDKLYYGKPDVSLLGKTSKGRNQRIFKRLRVNVNKGRTGGKTVNHNSTNMNDIIRYLANVNLDKQVTLDLITDMLRRIPSKSMSHIAKIQQIGKLLTDLRN